MLALTETMLLIQDAVEASGSGVTFGTFLRGSILAVKDLKCASIWDH